jgi:DNA-binding NarL/FixJ family response regulator
MDKLIAVEVDALTGKVIQRELTQEEKNNHQQLVLSQQEQNLALTQARASALAKLAALGLTEEEIAAL